MSNSKYKDFQITTDILPGSEPHTENEPKDINIPHADEGVLVLALEDGSWGSPHNAKILHLTDDEYQALCEGSELHQLQTYPSTVAQVHLV